MASSTYRVIGRDTPKVDGVAKVTGRAVFGADVKLPGMLVGKVLRSPHAHAVIRSIDTSRAESLRGVRAVVTSQDFPELVIGQATARGTVTPRDAYLSQEVMARDKALFVGHAVAAVAAVSRDVAEKALALVNVQYDPLPHVLDARKAMESDAPLLHESLLTKTSDEMSEKPGNIAEHLVYARGDVEAGFAEADAVVERSFRTGSVHHGYIEPDSEAAQVDADGAVTVWANTQSIYTQRQDIAVLLGIPISKIRVIPTEVGGGFGGKESVRTSALCVALSRKAGAPVGITLGRDEVLLATGSGNAIEATVKIGAREDGVITAIQANIIYDAGAFPGAPLRSALRRVFSLYRTPNLRIDAFDVVTNKPHVAAYRAPGATPTAFAVESVVDEVGEVLGMDPLEFRLKNASRPGDPMPDGVELPSVSLVDLLERARSHPCWTTPLCGDNRGRGLALGLWTMPGGTESCHVSLSGDGSLNLALGSIDLSATRTSMAMIAAETMGLELGDVHVVTGDTDTVAYSDASAGDKVTYVMSKAVQKACGDLLFKLKGRAAEDFGVQTSDILYDRKRFWVDGVPEMEVSLAALALRSVRGDGAMSGYGSVSESFSDVAIAPNAALHVADVQVDPETGKVDVLSYTTFQDVGMAVNPVQVQGQMQGGATQGIGWALSEGYDYDESGNLENATLLDYRLPTTLDVPFIGAEIAEFPSGDHPLGIRAVGQVPIVPAAGALANAIHDAVGVRISELPMKPETVFKAMMASRDARG
ncbi:MAG: xanthine dehydrogenase family protein molybdopterin-binding subunit [Chloroflexi bacterium]|nr:xanthine dehydrogenase family protein molybdopterin-binding subunit [Chloroflexota bacterium]